MWLLIAIILYALIFIRSYNGIPPLGNLILYVRLIGTIVACSQRLTYFINIYLIEVLGFIVSLRNILIFSIDYFYNILRNILLSIFFLNLSMSLNSD